MPKVPGCLGSRGCEGARVRRARQNLRDILFEAVPETRTLRRRETRFVLILLAMLAWRRLCSTICMAQTARNISEVIAWQLANEQSDLVFNLIQNGPCTRDIKFCDQIRDSSGAVAPLIAEGFARFTPAEFAKYLRWAKAELPKRKHICARVRREDISLKINSRRSGAYPSES